jgi:hypothetical protein
MPLERLTRAIFLKAEFGFLGVVVVTFKHTPLLKGDPFGSSVLFLCKVSKFVCNAKTLLLELAVFLPFLINWLIVGIKYYVELLFNKNKPDLPGC